MIKLTAIIFIFCYYATLVTCSLLVIDYIISFLFSKFYKKHLDDNDNYDKLGRIVTAVLIISILIQIILVMGFCKTVAFRLL
jgi:hypothetical protein